MKYFIIDNSLDGSIIGKDYPQVHKFIKGYDPRATNALFSLYKYYDDFPDYIPDLDGLMFSGSAKLTDFVSGGFGPNILIVSEKVKLIFEQYHLCPHRFYPVGLYKRKIKQNYYMFFIISDYSKFVNYEKSTFIEYSIARGKKGNAISLTSQEELFQKDKELEIEKGFGWGVWGDKIVMGTNFDKELDFFSISRIDGSTYVSERLKNDIESNGLTGWEFTPADNLIVED